ncbi:MAG: hypothetical protein OEU09_23175 [Rhodospirillales bacterium]|nr:hypothetical protein [Rhodospirillales bacterium]MDH3914191.1 hypothetical protein [Rhodospirillales bacterium]MDH3917387.1 hypothetical protein [Rhodospirillales bacterium]MDH3965394.1 hypothetical protein [Rhodospirillales bacterium]
MPTRTRRRLLFAALIAALALAGPDAPGPRAQAQGYIAEVEDLPLMPGLAEVEGAGVVFDKPHGRIVEAYAQGRVTREAVLAFYRQALPQLGWRADGGAAFRREGETLSLDFLDGGGALVVRFTLVPR